MNKYYFRTFTKQLFVSRKISEIVSLNHSMAACNHKYVQTEQEGAALTAEVAMTEAEERSPPQICDDRAIGDGAESILGPGSSSENIEGNSEMPEEGDEEAEEEEEEEEREEENVTNIAEALETTRNRFFRRLFFSRIS